MFEAVTRSPSPKRKTELDADSVMEFLSRSDRLLTKQFNQVSPQTDFVHPESKIARPKQSSISELLVLLAIKVIRTSSSFSLLSLSGQSAAQWYRDPHTAQVLTTPC